MDKQPPIIDTNKDKRDQEKAHNTHSIAVQPYLRKIIKLIHQRPKKSAFKVKHEIGLVHESWMKYCNKYVKIHKNKNKHPNGQAFIISIKMYFKANNVVSDKDFLFIFEV